MSGRSGPNEGNPAAHEPERDPVTGYETTGHDWAGIRELNTPFPRIVAWALIATFIYSAIAWVLLPAWPTGRDYTRGLLGLDQGEMARAGQRETGERRHEWLARFADEPDYDALVGDAPLMALAMPAAGRLYGDNCAMCHGVDGGGAPGFPPLNDPHWLWGGEPETIAETLAIGINSRHPETRHAVMPAFDWMVRSERLALSEYVAGLPSGQADHDSEAATLFAQNCVACHGERGAGGMGNGAPALDNESVIYGQDVETVMDTLFNGRQGVMPHWSDRLGSAEINLLALYVARLEDARAKGAQLGAAQ
jgi:cytochrome c oxidase cbb3-type subunit III